MAGFFDYGPLGVEIKNNIKKLWWRDMVQRREVYSIIFTIYLAHLLTYLFLI